MRRRPERERAALCAGAAMVGIGERGEVRDDMWAHMHREKNIKNGV
jgi:hypothetical protein